MRPVVGWIIRTFGAGTMLVFLLLLLTLSATAQGIAGLVRSLDPTLLFLTVGVGSGISWTLAKTQVRVRYALPFLVLCGVSVIAIQVGQLGGVFGELFRDLVDLDSQIRPGLFRSPLNWQPILGALGELGASLVTLTIRVHDWLLAMTSNKPAFDPVASAIVWSLALWAVSTWAAWGIRRNRQAVPALLPSLALLAITYAYTGADVLLLVWPAFTLLILMVVIGHMAREERWRTAGIDYSEDIRFDIALIVTPLAALLVGAAWLIPSISFQELARVAQQALSAPAQQARPLPDSLGLKPHPIATAAYPELRAPGLPRSHLIGSGPELSHEIVMGISTGDLPPMPQYTGLELQTPPSYYWRSTTYDRYTGGGWVTGDTRTIDYPAGQAAISSTVQAQRLVRQEVQANTDLAGLVYSAGTLVAADRDYRISWRSNDDAFSAMFDNGGDTYSADSLVSTATVDQLRTVRNDYPDWVRTRFMQLPTDTPQRVLSLARDLTATKPTPYDRAVAIETYLRTYSYTLDLPAPPPGRDIADYFLFDLKRGYCDYFATSMVVLARAAGLPARIVVGYATGTYDPATARYMVSLADAHSWPEIYFNQFGWIEFEPTSGRAPITRPGAADMTGNVKTLPPLTPRRTLLDEYGWLVLPAALLFLFLAAPAWLLLDLWWLGRKPPHEVVNRLYHRLYAQRRRLAVPTHPGDTPFEYTALLAERVSTLAPANHKDGGADAAASDLFQLADLYVRTSYSPYQPDNIDRWQALQMWRRANWRLWLAWLWQVPRRVMNRWASRGNHPGSVRRPGHHSF